MKTLWLGLALAVISVQVSAQVGGWHDADVIEKTSITNPAKAVRDTEGQWLAFSLPVLEDTRSPCCWKGRWNGKRTGMGEVGCSLEAMHQSYGSSTDSPYTEEVIVFSKIRGGKVQDLRVLGESCPLETNGARITWIGSVDTDAGLDWLENVARLEEHSAALFALALHRSTKAGKRLYSLARETDSDVSEEAIFWLGEARGEEGFKLLKRLLAELPAGNSRGNINFALSQNNTPEAAELLFEIGKSDSDPEQRGDAMFWLAQEYPQRAQDWLLEVINSEQDEDVLEQAVFAISQLPGEAGDMILLDLAKSNQTPRIVRRQALFWLAQSDNDESIAALTALLTR